MEHTEEIKWLSKHSEASMTLFEIVQDIRGLAKAFSITGNAHMSTSLMSIAYDVEKATKDMRDAIGECISEDIERSEGTSKAILEAVLAGALMERRIAEIKIG